MTITYKGDLDLTLGSLSHYAKDLDVTLKPNRLGKDNSLVGVTNAADGDGRRQ